MVDPNGGSTPVHQALPDDQMISHASHDMELHPLPTEFDPTAEPSMVIHDAAPGVDHALEDRLEGDLIEVGHLPGRGAGPISIEQERELDIERADDSGRNEDPALRHILQSLTRTEGEENGAVQSEEPGSVFSSPLSEVPELPNELPPTPEPLAKALLNPGPTLGNPAVTNGQSKSYAAESSATAAKRATGGKQASNGTKKTKRDRKSRSSEDDLESLSGIDELKDIHSLEIGTHFTAGDGQTKHKKLKGSDGKPVRSPGNSRKRPNGSISADGVIASPAKIAPRPKVLSEAKVLELLKGKTVECQMGPCLRPRYAGWGKCTQCVAKVGGDSCRFRSFRKFKIDSKTGDILGSGWFDSTDSTESTTPLPRDFNNTFAEKHILRTERTVAPLLLPLITGELRHITNNRPIKREVDAAKHRSVCDFCQSTIFAGYFMCKKCGKDYCLQCERFFSDTEETIGQSPWYLRPGDRPRVQRCSDVHGGRKGIFHHCRPDLQPISRFDEDEMKKHWMGLTDFVLDSTGSEEDWTRSFGLIEEDGKLKELLRTRVGDNKDRKGAKTLSTPALITEEVASFYTKDTNPSAMRIADPAELEELSLPFIFVPVDRLNNDTFDQLWTRGEPIIVDGVGLRLKNVWSPDTFIERFGTEACYLVDCETNKPHFTDIATFFSMWKDPDLKRNRVWKLKDWPSTNDFQSAYPDLYNDFCDSLPVPDFTRREGVLNLYAHFPPGPTRPDIGPKMYNAFAGKETARGKGSTRLHMDVADAINIMLYASPRPDGQPGCAVWDLFRAEDAPKLRKFLEKKFGGPKAKLKFTDPIHSQLFYLHADLRKELLRKHGVVSWRVYQYSGQAVFIPAGCAHQVCNLADCIKIALDFVSPHNVNRCQQLVKDFRSENFAKAWKEDVLQLYNVMWYAWLNSKETRTRHQNETAAEVAASTARASHLASLENGDHATISSSLGTGMNGASPARNGYLAPAVSSIRDERDQASQPVLPMNGEATATSESLGSLLAPEGSQSELPKGTMPNGVGGQTNGDHPVPQGVSETLRKVDPKRELALRLLEAAIAREEADPSKPRVAPSPVPPTPSAPAPPMTMGITDMVRAKILPIDLAVNAARLVMGEGAEDDDFTFGQTMGMDIDALDDMVHMSTAGMELETGNGGEGMEFVNGESSGIGLDAGIGLDIGPNEPDESLKEALLGLDTS